MPTLDDLRHEAAMKPIGQYKNTNNKTAACVIALSRYFNQSIRVEIREHFEANRGRRRDAYGILDLEAISSDTPYTRGLQACRLGKDWRDHIDKFRYEKLNECATWLSAPHRTLELWGWGKRRQTLKNGKKGKRWEWYVEVQFITVEFLLKEEMPTMLNVFSGESPYWEKWPYMDQKTNSELLSEHVNMLHKNLVA